MLPNDIADGETIVRAVRTPQHIKNNKLRPAAFRPRGGSSQLSVIRQLIGDDRCKAEAVRILDKTYIGLATILAEKIRQLGQAVTDAPEDFEGHAHIEFGFTVAPNEPPSVEQLNCFGRLAEAAITHIDPASQDEGWQGPPLAIA